jgi:hypothetical protein
VLSGLLWILLRGGFCSACVTGGERGEGGRTPLNRRPVGRLGSGDSIGAAVAGHVTGRVEATHGDGTGRAARRRRLL